LCNFMVAKFNFNIFHLFFSAHHNLGLLDIDIQVVFLHSFFHSVQYHFKIFLILCNNRYVIRKNVGY
jgi:hypothetical protein